MKRIIFLICLTYSFTVNAQLTVSSSFTADQYVNFLVGTGVSYSNATFSGDTSSIGQFTTGANPTNLGMNQGIIMSTGYVNASGTPSVLIGSPVTNFVSDNSNGVNNDPDLSSLVSVTVNDAAILEFDFIPESDTISFNYIFASEEYPEYVCSSFNDVFGFFLSGANPAGGNYTSQNIAIIPGTTLPVAINSVNSGSPGGINPASGCTSLAYSMYYVDNQGQNGQTIVFDGFTTVLTAKAAVVPCTPYHIKLAIGDGMDNIYDSGVFLLKNSFSSPVVTPHVYYANGISSWKFCDGRWL